MSKDEYIFGILADSAWPKTARLLDTVPPFCPVCACGGNWHYPFCQYGLDRGDKIWVNKITGALVELDHEARKRS